MSLQVDVQVVERAGVVWQSPADGLWRLAIYAHRAVRTECADFDPALDVEHDYESFSWGSEPVSTCVEALDLWPGNGHVEVVGHPHMTPTLDWRWNARRDKWISTPAFRRRQEIDRAQAALYSSGTLRGLRSGSRVFVRSIGAAGPEELYGSLRRSGDWLVLPRGKTRTLAVYNSKSRKLHVHGGSGIVDVQTLTLKQFREYGR